MFALQFGPKFLCKELWWCESRNYVPSQGSLGRVFVGFCQGRESLIFLQVLGDENVEFMVSLNPTATSMSVSKQMKICLSHTTYKSCFFIGSPIQIIT